MSSQKRHQFLTQKWNRYPSMGRGQVMGRVVLIEREKSFFTFQVMKSLSSAFAQNSLVQLQIDHTAQLQNFSDVQELMEVLRKGDLLALEVSKEGKVHFVQLLTPFQEGLLNLTADTFNCANYAQAVGFAEFLQCVRDFFTQNQILEVRTPSLVINPGTEPTLDVFSTEFKMGKTQKKYFLPTSPELSLKKLLARGFPQIYEIKECFRNGEISSHHQPEFLMLEWYRAFAGLQEIEQDICNLLHHLQSKWLKQKEMPIKLITNQELFHMFTGLILTPQSTRDDLKAVAKKMEIYTSGDDSFNDLYFRIFLEKIEPHLKPMGAVIVKDYPPSQAALARINPEGWADRFELYINGLEIANAFHELNDPEIQAKRFEQDLLEKKRLGKETQPLDEEFLNALKTGMPPSGGIALGVERLFMALTGESEISKVRLFYHSL